MTAVGQITVEQVLSWWPCEEYTRERLEELAAGRAALTVEEVLDLPIPAAHRLWVMLRREVLSEDVLCEFVTRLARRIQEAAVRAGREQTVAEYVEAAAYAFRAAGRAAWVVADMGPGNLDDKLWLAANKAEYDAQVEILRELIREARP